MANLYKTCKVHTGMPTVPIVAYEVKIAFIIARKEIM